MKTQTLTQPKGILCAKSTDDNFGYPQSYKRIYISKSINLFVDSLISKDKELMKQSLKCLYYEK
jgi:hypothetical protein